MSELTEWQQFILDAYAKDPKAFKRAIAWYPSRGHWKRQAEQELIERIAIVRILKGETE